MPERPGDRKTAAIDLTKTKADLKWCAKTKLKDHLQEFLHEFENNHEKAW